ncbi:YqgE/AlgH family protein [Pedobacter fastidiosus]|uniref:YqgE/AlgH family protein n=1 Tax=Pedobacter fastidiosus TaxID=2765361 RepID=A0ABR7KN44_9SPHI|nr:YqgE/AlgH family protein [Pedobacter fastidiosus]MBC6109374.1 YqgE/AlgH family protein [Pedobacter fastidiosus]
MLNNIKPKTGRLLISEPFMADPNFKRSVVLLTQHDEDGSVGYILNQIGNLILSDIIQDLWEGNNHIYFGGPVATDTLHFIHRCYDKLQSGEPIGNGLYWGGNFETLKILINTNAISEEEIKFFMGYSGWDDGQLARELNQNSWMVSDVSNPDIIFNVDDEKLWRDVIVNLGPKYAHISNFPTDPNLN